MTKVESDFMRMILNNPEYVIMIFRRENAQVDLCIRKVGAHPHLRYRDHLPVCVIIAFAEKNISYLLLDQSRYLLLSC